MAVKALKKNPATKKPVTKAPPKKPVEEVAQVVIPPLGLRQITFRLNGTSPLVVHPWSDKGKREMADRQGKKATKAREKREPWKEYCEALYWLSEKPKEPKEADIKKATFGIRASAVKKACIEAARYCGLAMTYTKGAFHVIAEARNSQDNGRGNGSPGEFIVIHSGAPEMREDIVRVSNGQPDLRYRPEFYPWWVNVTLEYNYRVFSPEQLGNLLMHAGFHVGLGEMRPGKSGDSYGRFELARSNKEPTDG